MSWDDYENYGERFGDWKPRIQMKRAGEFVPQLTWMYNITGPERHHSEEKRARRGQRTEAGLRTDGRGMAPAGRPKKEASVFGAFISVPRGAGT